MILVVNRNKWNDENAYEKMLERKRSDKKKTVRHTEIHTKKICIIHGMLDFRQMLLINSEASIYANLIVWNIYSILCIVMVEIYRNVMLSDWLGERVRVFISSFDWPSWNKDLNGTIFWQSSNVFLPANEKSSGNRTELIFICRRKYKYRHDINDYNV